jgi:hypothetical protein
LSTLAFTYFTIVIITPKIEGYSQLAAIEFYIEHKNEECYIQPIGFKTYANLYYSNKKFPANPQSYDEDWLLTGAIDKPAYFVMKSGQSDRIMARYPQLKALYSKNGFVFAKREVGK